MKNKNLLISGMDFSGKSSVVNEIAKRIFNAVRRVKFISPTEKNVAYHKIEEMKTSPTWNAEWDLEQRKHFNRIMCEVFKYDIHNFQQLNKQVIHDTCLLLKHQSRIIQESNDAETFECQKKLISLLPNMDSVFLKTTSEETLRRYYLRVNARLKLTRDDQRVIDNPKGFYELSDIYQEQVFKQFPKTRIIDTTSTSPDEIADEILKGAINI